MGDGSSPSSLSRAGIWRLISGAASFPTLFSTASGVSGLVAGPLSIPFSRTTELLSEAFQLASGRWLRHRLVNQVKTRLRLLLRVLTALHKVSHCFWQRVYPMPRVSPLNSQVAFRSQISGIVFNIADSTGGFHGLCLCPVSSPVKCSVCLAFRRLSFWRLPVFFGPPESFHRADTQ